MTVTKTRDTTFGNLYTVYGTLTFGASEVYATGGNTCSFIQSAIKATRKPVVVWITGINGYSYAYIPGTTAADGKVKVCTTAATELGAGTVPAGVSGDTIIYEAVFAGEL